MAEKSIKIVLSLDRGQYSAELQRAGQQVQQFGTQASASMDRASAGAQALTGHLARMGHAAMGALAVHKLVEMADAVTTLNNQLKLATGSAGAAGQAYEALFDIAQRARVSFTELGGTYAAIARNAGELGMSQAQLLKVTESIGNAMAISGGSAASMQAALVQLGQGMASGVLRGEELNSVMEQTPRLARAIADGMGVTVGQLRELGAQGQLTAQAVLAALQSQAAVLAREVAGSQLTVGQALVQLSNAGTQAVGALDKATGASAGLADAVSGAAKAVGAVGQAIGEHETALKTGLGLLAGAATVAGAQALAGALAGAGGVAGAIGVVRGAFVALGVAMAANPVGLALLGIGAATGAAMALHASRADSLKGLAQELDYTSERIAKAERQLAAAGGPGQGALTRQLEERIAAMRKAREELQQRWAEKSTAGLDTSAEDARLARQTQQQLAQKQADADLTEARRKLYHVNKDYLGELAKLHGLYEAGRMPLAEYRQHVAQLASDTYKASSTGKAAAEALRGMGKAAQEGGNAFAAQQEAAKAWAATLHKAAQGIEEVEGKSLQLSAAQQALVHYLTSPAYAHNSEDMRQMALDRLYAWEAAIQHADGLEKERQALRASDAAIGAWADSRAKDAQALQAQIDARQQEVNALDLSAEAVAQLAAAKQELLALEQEEYAAALRAVADKTGPYREAYWQAAQEAQARAAGLRQLAALDRAKGEKQAAQQAAQDAAKEWQKSADQINSTLTDALLRGFESGKDFARNLRDTVVNMFKSLVLRPVISAVMSPVSMAVNGLVQGGMNAIGLGSSALGVAGNVASLGSAAGMLGSVGTAAGYGASALFSGNALGALSGGFGMLTSGGPAAIMAQGAGMIAGVLGPIALGIGALVAISKATKGETRTGGQFGVAFDGQVTNQRRGQVYQYVGQQYDRDFTGGQQVAMTSGQAYRLEGDPVGSAQEAILRKAVAGTAQGITDILKNLGSSAVVTGFWAGLETSEKGRGGVFAGGMLSNGARFGESGQGDNYLGTLYEKFSTNSPDFKKALEEFTLDLKQSTLQALQTVTDLPKGVQAMLKDVDIESLDLAAVDALLVKIADYPNQLLQQFGSSRDDLVKTFVTGLQTGDALAAGQAVADQFVGGIEQTMLGAAAGQIFDIINTGVLMPILDGLMAGQSIAEVMSQASIDAAVARAQQTATAFAAIWNDAKFQEVMEQVRTTVGTSLGQAGTALQYQPRYVERPAASLAGAGDAAATAADEARKKWEDFWKSLRSDRDSAEIDLLRALGQEEAALARERAKAIEGLDAEQVAYYDQTQAIKKQAEAAGILRDLRAEQADLELAWLRASGQEAQASALAYEKATRGMDAEQRAVYDGNRALEQRIALLDRERALMDRLPGVVDLFISPAQRQAAAYDRIAGDLINAGLTTMDRASLSAGLARATKEEIAQLALQLWNTGQLSVQAREALLGAGEALAGLKDAAAQAAEEAARAAEAERQRIEQERLGLENTLLQLLGDTAEIRKRELAALDPSNRALQERIWALQDAKEAQDQYNSSLKNAQDFLAGAVKNIEKFIFDTRLAQAQPEETYALSAAKLASQLVLARGGDREALGGITGYAQTVIDAIRQDSSSQAEEDLRVNKVLAQLGALPKQVSAEQFIVDGVTGGLDSLQLALVGQLVGGFDGLDTSLDGLLSFDELRAAGLASDNEVRRLIGRVDSNGDGMISKTELLRYQSVLLNNKTDGVLGKLDSIVSNTGATAGNTASWGSGTAMTVTFAAGDPLRSVFNNISRTNELMIDGIQLELHRLLGVSISENLTPLGPLNSEFPGMYKLQYDQMALLTDIRNYLGPGGALNYLQSLATNANNVTSGVGSYKVRFDRGTASGGPGGLVFAKGGVFTNTVVSRPTRFELGLMGEAGPEAIMPLASGPDGSLGVRVHGGLGAAPGQGMAQGMTQLAAQLEALHAELRALREDQRAQASAIAGHAARSAQAAERTGKLQQQWERDGLPPARQMAEV